MGGDFIEVKNLSEFLMNIQNPCDLAV